MPPQTKNLHVNNNDIKQPTTQHERDSISTPVNHTTESFEKKIIPENNHSNPFTHWYGQELKWRNIIFLAIIHVLSVIAFFTYPWTFDKATIRLFTFNWVYAYTTSLGVTAGAHRLWTHRAYVAKTPWKFFLMLCFMAAGQNSLVEWVLDHRVHHKYSETSADPHDASRGFFYSHCGWLMVKKRPEVIAKGKLIDMSDVINDPVVKFAEKYYVVLKILLTWVVPILLPMLLWDDPFLNSFYMRMMLWIYSLNGTWAVNSAAHIWGSKPYDKRINPAENRFVIFIAAGEGFHNYHHTFPWDYKAAETPFYIFNTTTFFIDCAAYFGLVTQRKQPSKEIIAKMASKYGDGSHENKTHAEMEIDETVDICMDY